MLEDLIEQLDDLEYWYKQDGNTIKLNSEDPNSPPEEGQTLITITDLGGRLEVHYPGGYGDDEKWTFDSVEKLVSFWGALVTDGLDGLA